MKTTKRFTLLLVLILILVTIIPVAAQTNQDIKLWINGKYVETDVAPIIENDRTLVPVRVISESLGAIVEWDAEEQLVSIMDVDIDLNNLDDELNILKFKNFFILAIGETELIKVNADYMQKLLTDELKEGIHEVSDEDVEKNSTIVPMDTAAKIVDGRTMVPIRVIAEQLGVKVDWDADNRTV
ncbi:MAG: copper amine oxidase N-terminal domain-containing protein, partial [Tissierellia bacterium]|nr:copper amine oxidase N-terminal domain-containing protein [Tissierellia bacterium]